MTRADSWPASTINAMPAATTIYLATGNAHKVGEFRALAQAEALPLEIRSARELGGMPEVVEDAGTFEGNARKKARALRPLAPGTAWVLADDSGLCVDALGGAPGVESAYFAGPQGDSRANLEKLLRTMEAVPDGSRQGRFYCLLFAIGPDGLEQVFDGTCEGSILRAARGAQGFGYDPAFAVDGEGCSMAELAPERKNALSHRGRAWAAFARFFRNYDARRHTGQPERP